MSFASVRKLPMFICSPRQVVIIDFFQFCEWEEQALVTAAWALPVSASGRVPMTSSMSGHQLRW